MIIGQHDAERDHFRHKTFPNLALKKRAGSGRIGNGRRLSDTTRAN